VLWIAFRYGVSMANVAELADARDLHVLFREETHSPMMACFKHKRRDRIPDAGQKAKSPELLTEWTRSSS
jgi:hypothetical protein